MSRKRKVECSEIHAARNTKIYKIRKLYGFVHYFHLFSQGWKMLMKNLMSTLFGTWPVLVTALLFSWLSGMIIWFVVRFIDTGSYHHEF
jgi:hypothetical protein